MTDQQKATAIDLYGGPVRTPNLARIAAQGRALRAGLHAPPAVRPGAGLALDRALAPQPTGRAPTRPPMPRGETHLAALLHGAGYRLGHFGKNHCFTAGGLRRLLRPRLPRRPRRPLRPGRDHDPLRARPRPRPPARRRRPGTGASAARWRTTRSEPPRASATYRVVDEACAVPRGARRRRTTPSACGSPSPTPTSRTRCRRRTPRATPRSRSPCPPGATGELEGKPERQRVYWDLLNWAGPERSATPAWRCASTTA